MTYQNATTGELAASTRVALAWIEDLERERAQQARIDAVVELMRPLFVEYRRRVEVN